MTTRSTVATLAFAFGLALLSPSGASACTGLMLKAKDGSVVHGRTAEFGVQLDLGIGYIPKGTAFTGHAPQGDGMAYEAKYAAVGITAFGAPTLLDGLNEAGLAAAAFYFPTFASYPEVTAQTAKKAVAPTEFTNYLLTQFATVDDVKKALASGAAVIAPPWTPNGDRWPRPSTSSSTTRRVLHRHRAAGRQAGGHRQPHRRHHQLA